MDKVKLDYLLSYAQTLVCGIENAIDINTENALNSKLLTVSDEIDRELGIKKAE